MKSVLIFCLILSIDAGPPRITSFTGPSYKTIPFQLETLTLRCTATGNPSPTISFVRNGTTLTAGARIVIGRGFVQISRVDYVTDDGFYQCLAKNKDGGTLSEIINIRIRVLGNFPAPYRPIDLRTYLDATVGRPMEISCPSRSYTYPLHTLWGDIPTTGRPVVLHANKKRFVLSNGNLFYSYLEESDVKEINTKLGGVSCILYILGKYRPSVKFLLRKQGTIASDFAPTFRERLPRTVAVGIGALHTLFCATAGKPVPTIIWYFNNAQIRTGSPGILISSTGHKLTLQSVGRASAGLYYCQVQNRLGTIRSDSQLRVEFSPSRNPKLRDTKSTTGVDVTLNCTGAGTWPIFYQWYRNGQILTSNFTYVISGGALRIKKVNVSTTAMFQCMAKNKYGNLLSNVYLDVKEGYGVGSEDDKFSWEIIVAIVCGGVAFILLITAGAYFILK